MPEEKEKNENATETYFFGRPGVLPAAQLLWGDSSSIFYPFKELNNPSEAVGVTQLTPGCRPKRADAMDFPILVQTSRITLKRYGLLSKNIFFPKQITAYPNIQ